MGRCIMNQDSRDISVEGGDYREVIIKAGGTYVEGNYTSVLETAHIKAEAGRDQYINQIEGGVGVLNVYGSVHVDRAANKEAKQISRQEYRWRKVLLDRVKNFWIDGVLTKSLHTQVLMNLGLEERKNLVQNPLSEVEEFPSDTKQLFPEGTTISKIFQDIGTGRTLLILGEPGSGKTVALLKLAESIIARAEADSGQPLPVVMNLSSWANKREPIDHWLVKELHRIYTISKLQSQTWIEREELILLLDGLDEVDLRYQNDCVNALNQFVRKHGLTEIVVCSRVRDYEALTECLSLCSAIYVQPLTSQQIDHFLEQAGESLSPLKAILQDNAELREFASSPLILSIMSLTYQGCSVQALIQTGNLEEQRRHLFDNYIERMFARRGTTRQYSKERVLQWLSRLAWSMARESQTIFLIERLQPSWLSSLHQRWGYRLGVVLVVSLIVGVVLWLVDSWLIDFLSQGSISERTQEIVLQSGAPDWLWLAHDSIARAAIGLVAGSVIGLRTTIKPIETLRWSRAQAWSGAIHGLQKWSILGLVYLTYIGLVAGLIGGSIYHLSLNLSTELISEELVKWNRVIQIAGAFPGLVAAVTAGLIIRPDACLARWHDGKLYSRPRVALISGLITFLGLTFSEGLAIASATGLCIAIIVGLCEGASNRLVLRLVDALIVSLVVGLAVALLGGLSTWFASQARFDWSLNINLQAWMKLWLSIGLGLGTTGGILFSLIASYKESVRQVESLPKVGPARGWFISRLRKGLNLGVIIALILSSILILLINIDKLSIVKSILLIANRMGIGSISVLGFSGIGALIGASFGIVLFPILGALIGMISGGLTGPNLEIRSTPNQGIRQSAINIGIFALIGGLTLGLVWGLFNLLPSLLLTGLTPRALDWLRYGSHNILVMGVICALVPGAACLQHFTLRFILWCNELAPWNYARFLSYAVDRHFLQNVGGGFIFVHRLLMEHLARMEQTVSSERLFEKSHSGYLRSHNYHIDED